MQEQILKDKKIFILEDEREVLESLQVLFESYECKVVTVSLASQVIPTAEKEIPDLFILDVMLPDENGIEIYAELKKHPFLHVVPVIFLTGVNAYELGRNWNPERIAEQYFVDPPEAFIEKPFDPEQLIREVIRILKGS